MQRKISTVLRGEDGKISSLVEETETIASFVDDETDEEIALHEVTVWIATIGPQSPGTLGGWRFASLEEAEAYLDEIHEQAERQGVAILQSSITAVDRRVTIRTSSSSQAPEAQSLAPMPASNNGKLRLGFQGRG